MLLSVALLVKITIILWFVRHIYGLDDISSTVAHQHSFLSVMAIIIVLAVTLLTWLATIRNLYRSQKTILANNAEPTQTEEVLQQSEAYFRELFENANDLIYTTDLQGNFTSLNKVGEIITGYTRDEACQMHFAQVVAPEYLELARGMFALKRENNVPTTYEIEFITKSGERIALDISNRLVYEVGEPIGVQGIGRDITDRKQNEEALRESEARYRVVTESASDAILTIDHEQTILFVNSAAENIFGYAVDELLGNKLFMLMPERMRGAHAAGMKRYNETNKRNISWQGVELPALHKNGHEVPIEVTFGEISSDGKRLFTAVIRDITERKKAEEVLQRSESRYRMLFDSNPNPVLVFDLETLQILAVNQEATRHYGYTHEEFLEMSLKNIRPPEDISVMLKQVAVCAASQDKLTYSVRHQKKDGTIFDVEIAAHQITFAGRAARLVLITDITERKRAKEELQQNLSLLTSTFEATAEGILVVDRNNKIVTCNRRFIEMWQIPAEIIDSKDNAKAVNYVLEQLSNADDFANMTKHLTHHPENKSFDILKFKDGKIFEHYSHPQMLDGTVVGRVVSFRDITTRTRAEDTLRESESILAAAQRITHLGSWELDLADLEDLSKNAVRWSDETYRIFGYEPGQVEISNEVFYNSVHPDDRTRLSQVLIEAIEQRKIYNIEHRIILPDGSERILHGQAELIFDNRTDKPLKLLGTVQDITERKRAEELIRQSEEKYRSILETIEEGYFETDLEGIFTFYNEALGDVLGYDTDELLGMHYRRYVDHRNEKKLFISYVKVYRTGQPLSDLNWEVIRKDGTRRFLESSITLIRNAADIAVGFRGLVRDITGRKQTEEALRESEYKLRTLVTSMSEGLTQVNNEEVIEFVNDRLCEMTGYERDELLGKVTLEIFFDEEGRKLLEGENRQRHKGITGQYEIRLKKKSGEMLWVLIGGSPIVNADGKVTGTLGVFTDITERKRAEEQLLHDAFHDGLTGLANRALFMDHLRMTIKRSKSRHSNPYAVLFLDFDRFKVVNDSLGHAEGDKLLDQIARRLECLTRPGDLVARLGGDEFVILLSEMLAESDAVLVAERIQNDFKQPFDLSGSEIFISASIGIALSKAGHKLAEDMVRDADIAMYHAKAKGKAQHQIFDQAMHEFASKQLRLETEMRQSLERGEFQLYYQPIISLETETLVGFEALVRWQHPTRGMIPPFEFIGAAEENGLILPLGNWILQESCRQLRRWQDDNPAASHLTVSVNLSCKQFLQSDLAEQIAATLRATGLDPRCLKLEITESHIMENSEMAVTIMNRLRALGVEISLDDFGTGYSSLSYLHRLPVDYLKIDRSFVSRMTDSNENSEIVFTIIKLAQNLKMKVIAEGIETADQLAHLKRLNCEYGQGYFFSKPLEAKAAEKFIEENGEAFSLMLNETDVRFELNM